MASTGLALADSPFRLVTDALWTMAEARSEFTDLFLVGNRIKFTGTDRAPMKDGGLQPGDFPEVTLILDGIGPHPDNTSNSSFCQLYFHWEVRSGDQRFQTLLDACFIIYRCMSDWPTYLDDALSWEGIRFATCLRFERTGIGLDAKMNNMDLDPRTKNLGWTVVYRGAVDMFFRTLTIQEQA